MLNVHHSCSSHHSCSRCWGTNDLHTLAQEKTSWPKRIAIQQSLLRSAKGNQPLDQASAMLVQCTCTERAPPANWKRDASGGGASPTSIRAATGEKLHQTGRVVGAQRVGADVAGAEGGVERVGRVSDGGPRGCRTRSMRVP